MKIAVRTGITLGLVAGLAFGGYAVAGLMLKADAASKIAIGDAMPDFKLKCTGGNEHTLSGHKGEIVVLNFSSQTCPFSKGADPSINDVAKKYEDKGVVFLGIDSNVTNSVEDIAKHIEDAGISYPILKDEGNTYADALGAKVTPEIFIVDKEGKLAYHGAPDNRTGPEAEPTERYLDDALAALTAGEAVKTTTTSAWGCGIKRGKK